ncbi:MAG: hypothetical protein Q8O89_03085 [Nanoarchaeota archaeon]|nr:hypothetical protein [Nanoarchaeota archaeon]
MEQSDQNNTPHLFIVTNDYVLGTPRGIASCDKTIDMTFLDFAKNYELQTKLKLVTVISENQGSKAFAGYLSAFASDSVEQQQRRDYLTNNGLVRLLVTNDKLFESIRDTT